MSRVSFTLTNLCSKLAMLMQVPFESWIEKMQVTGFAYFHRLSLNHSKPIAFLLLQPCISLRSWHNFEILDFLLLPTTAIQVRSKKVKWRANFQQFSYSQWVEFISKMIFLNLFMSFCMIFSYVILGSYHHNLLMKIK